MKDLWLYAAVSRIKPLSYRGKIMLVAFLGTHIPLIAVALYVAFQTTSDWRVLALTLAVTLGATLGGTAVTLFALHHLLRPVILTADTLRQYRESRAKGFLPKHFDDEAGHLMADARLTIEQLDGSLQVLEHINQDLESFSYAVAHDLRGPLRRMTGFAQLMSADIEAGHLVELPVYADYIADNARKMTELVDGLLHLAQTSHGELAMKRIEMGPQLEEVLEEQQARGRAKIELGALPVVSADAATLRQVWANLVSNALKYSSKREQPRIQIGWHAEGADAVFFVKDNGSGFDPAHARKLFNAFQRLHETADFEGSGVGLATVRRIVQRHGGRIWAESRLGSGATFYFTLPMHLVQTGA